MCRAGVGQDGAGRQRQHGLQRRIVRLPKKRAGAARRNRHDRKVDLVGEVDFGDRQRSVDRERRVGFCKAGSIGIASDDRYHRRVVVVRAFGGAEDGDGHVLRGGADARVGSRVAVVHRDREDDDDLLAGAQEIDHVLIDRVVPGDGAVVGVASHVGDREGVLNRRLLCRGQFRRRRLPGLAQPDDRLGRLRGDRPVRQVDIGKGDRPYRVEFDTLLRGIRLGDIENRALDIDGGNDRRVVAALDGDRHRGRVGVAALVPQRVGEGFGAKFTSGKEIESARRIVGEGARGADQQVCADGLVRGVGRQHYRGQPGRIEHKRLAVHLCDGEQRVEAVRIEVLARRSAGLGQADHVLDQRRVLVHRIGVVIGDRRVVDIRCRIVEVLVAARHLAARTIALAALVAAGPGVRIVTDLLERAGSVYLRAVAQGMGDHFANVGHRDLVLEQVEAGLGNLHSLVRQRVDDPLVADGLDRAEDLAARLVDDDIAADLAGIRIGQNAEFGDTEFAADHHLGRGAANTHRCDRRLDFHVAGRRDGPGDEDERPLHEVDHHRTVLRLGRVVDEFVEHHAAVGRHREQRIVEEGDAELGVGSGLHDVALIDDIADRQRHLDAVGTGGFGRAGQRQDLADLDEGCLAAQLGVLTGRQRTGERGNDLRRQVGAIGRGEVRRGGPAEVAEHQCRGAVMRDDEVAAMPRIVAKKQRFRLGDENRAGSVVK